MRSANFADLSFENLEYTVSISGFLFRSEAERNLKMSGTDRYPGENHTPEIPEKAADEVCHNCFQPVQFSFERKTLI